MRLAGVSRGCEGPRPDGRDVAGRHHAGGPLGWLSWAGDDGAQGVHTQSLVERSPATTSVGQYRLTQSSHTQPWPRSSQSVPSHSLYRVPAISGARWTHRTSWLRAWRARGLSVTSRIHRDTGGQSRLTMKSCSGRDSRKHERTSKHWPRVRSLQNGGQLSLFD